MQLPTQRRSIPLVFAVILALVAGCGSSPPSPTPTPAPIVQAPTATFVPTATARPTATPTKVPTPTPVANAAVALLEQVQGKQQDVKSARGLMEIVVSGTGSGTGESATVNVDFDLNEPDMRMAMKITGEEKPMPFDMEIRVVDETVYLNIGGDWMAFPVDEEQPGLGDQRDLVDMNEIEAFLSEAENVKVIGRRSVRGVQCDVVAFTLPDDRLLELAREQSAVGADEVAIEDIQIGAFQGEFAIGVEDKLLHQMVLNMSMFDKTKPSAQFNMTFTTTLWDVNAPNIVIEAPVGVTPFGVPEQTPAPRA